MSSVHSARTRRTKASTVAVFQRCAAAALCLILAWQSRTQATRSASATRCLTLSRHAGVLLTRSVAASHHRPQSRAVATASAAAAVETEAETAAGIELNDFVEPWVVRVPAQEGAEGAGRLSASTLQQAAESIKNRGFVILRGASLFTDRELERAHEAAIRQFQIVQAQASTLGLDAFAPWHALCKELIGANLFKFQEAVSYSKGRLDMPLPPDQGLHAHPDLLRLSQELFGEECKVSAHGAFWNFPCSGPAHWHRDGGLPLLTAVTTGRSYPEDAGFMSLQPFSHAAGYLAASDAHTSPMECDEGGVEVSSILKRGETVLFLYSTKHAPTPNLSDVERCLLYSVYGPEHACDTVNLRSTLPSLLDLRADEARILAELARKVGSG